MDMITISEARLLVSKTHGDISEHAIRNWAREGRLTNVDKSNKIWLISKEEFLQNFYTVLTPFVEKGGTGKSRTSVALCDFYEKKGLKVLVVGFDPQMNVDKCFFEYEWLKTQKGLYDYFEHKTPLKKLALKYSDNVDVIQATRALSSKRNQYDIAKLEDFCIDFRDLYKKYDIVIQDTGPIVDSLSILALMLSNYAIIPFPPEDDSMDGALDAVEHISRYTRYTDSFIDFKVLLNNYEYVGGRGIAIHNHFADEAIETFVDKLIDSYIPHYTKLKERRITKTNIFENDNDHTFQKKIVEALTKLDNFFFKERKIG